MMIISHILPLLKGLPLHRGSQTVFLFPMRYGHRRSGIFGNLCGKRDHVAVCYKSLFLHSEAGIRKPMELFSQLHVG